MLQQQQQRDLMLMLNRFFIAEGQISQGRKEKLSKSLEQLAKIQGGAEDRITES
jgi:hypothetical protein